MPTHKSAAKRLRQSEKRRLHSRTRRSQIRSLTKQIREDPGAAQAPELLKEVSVLLDRHATRGLHHQNKANRLKSNLSKLIQSAQNSS